jgi:hypothetical protein
MITNVDIRLALSHGKILLGWHILVALSTDLEFLAG